MLDSFSDLNHLRVCIFFHTVYLPIGTHYKNLLFKNEGNKISASNRLKYISNTTREPLKAVCQPTYSSCIIFWSKEQTSVIPKISNYHLEKKEFNATAHTQISQ